MGVGGPLDTNYDEDTLRGRMTFRARLITVSICIVVTLVFNLAGSAYLINTVPDQVRSQVQDATLRAAERNCETQASGRILGNLFKFGIREELTFIPDLVSAAGKNKRETPRAKAFFAGEIAQLNQDTAIERLKYPPSALKAVGLPPLPDHVTSFADFLPFLQDSPALGCSVAQLTR